MSLLFIEQKKGDPSRLDGRLTVYVTVDIDPAEMAATKHPVASLVQNGLLVAQGNFRDQNSLRDFLKSEMGVSLEEGLDQLLEKMDGIEGALDPQKLKDKLENMDEIEDFFPTPAKIVPFHSEEEILSQEGDVFYGGLYKKIGNAILCVNALPILYQARYREQVLLNIRSEIDQLISQIESNVPPAQAQLSESDFLQKLEKEFIPSLLYSRNNPKDFTEVESHFRTFLDGYRFKQDIDAIIHIIKLPQELTRKHFKLLELYAKKIAEVRKEHFAEAEKIRLDIESVEKELLQ
jgi:hypothetical protein